MLIVDDNANLVEAIKEGLRCDYSVKGVYDASSALQEINRTRYDCVILDVGLPDMSGMDLLKILRKNTVSFDIPVIIFTVRGEYENMIAGIKKGADKYLTKSTGLAELKVNVKALLRRIKYDLARKNAPNRI